jgi:Holliday junction resolvasome RuvABC endonuclease subunit
VLVLAIDPGPTMCWWAVLDKDVYVDAGFFLSTDGQILNFVVGKKDYTTVVIEEPTVGRRQAAKLIHQTGLVTGFIRGAFSAYNVAVKGIRAFDWRKCTVGVHNASDEAIKEFVLTNVKNLPKKTNVHIRDALGLAYASLSLTSKRI